MKRRRLFLVIVAVILVLSGCSDGDISSGDNDDASGQRVVVDMAGREVEIPEEINSAFSTGASGTVFLYTIDPALLIGTNYEFNNEEKEYIIDEYKDLPAYGQGGNINQEALIAASPDICVSYGSISDSEISYADTMQNQTGIPFLIVDGSLDSAAEAYRFLGEVLNRQDDCEKLALYAEKALDFAASLNVPNEERVSVYFGNGHESLETAPVGSPHAELLDIIGAVNVANLEEIDDVARIDISAEQVIGWDPQVIVINGEPSKNLSPRGAADKFKEDMRYKNVQAVENGKVYPIPKYPFSWFDRPPGVNRLIGIYWLADILYPEHANLNVEHEMQEFYTLFYHMELEKDQIDVLLGR
ncbi:MAG TPA: ABC transporter substrate-binding protein [Anaerovoracaceae bacterium]|nr:ABC transporter substrate-binding protein [Anaerovoracaceae bacterium]